MALVGFLIALCLFLHFRRRLERTRRRYAIDECKPCRSPEAASWREEWHRHWADKFHRQAERRLRHIERTTERRLRWANRRLRRFGLHLFEERGVKGTAKADADPQGRGEIEVLRRARRRAAAEVSFYWHLMIYLGVIAFLALVNLMTARYPWFLWPAIGWGIGLFFHYMAVFGSHMLRERYFEPAVQREVRREKVVMHTEKQASIDELSATIAHEIRNPIAAAKSLVQQMGEDPTSVENVDYAKVAIEELDRVERRVSHLLKYAKEEEYTFDHVNLAAVVDSALTQMRAKLDAAAITVARHYIGGPTIFGDQEKLRQVFVNVVANAVDALDRVAEGRRLQLFIENRTRNATVRVCDNGCGIPAEKIDKIFNPFFTTKENGTGLGMAIAKKIVEAHEGRIDVVSEPGRRTEFIITLPLPQ